MILILLGILIDTKKKRLDQLYIHVYMINKLVRGINVSDFSAVKRSTMTE